MMGVYINQCFSNFCHKKLKIYSVQSSNSLELIFAQSAQSRIADLQRIVYMMSVAMFKVL